MLLFILSLCSCSDNLPGILKGKDIETYLVWDKNSHCAFTDLVEYNGKIYCCFREANKHVPDNVSEFGCIRIVESIDGINWESIGTISDLNFDLRDPKLTVTPDLRLLLLFGRYSPDTNSNHLCTAAKFISDEEICSKELKNDYNIISIENDPNLSRYWLWKIKWINEEAYGIAYYNGKYPILVKSKDGINYSLICELSILGNEADIELLPDGSMLIVVRAQNGNGFIGLSSDDSFDKWDWIETSHLIHCPAILQHDNKIYIAGRSIWGTALYVYRNNNIEPLVILPIGGMDNAYPGIIYKDNQIWISYYGDHNNGVGVFLSKIPLDKIKDE